MVGLGVSHEAAFREEHSCDWNTQGGLSVLQARLGKRTTLAQAEFDPQPVSVPPQAMKSFYIF